ncbi:phosphatidylinositol 4-phosphate 5-kinase-like protein 1 [Sceloporus undulatus]|uniref:phosphatidylinositol 4-phosphate 5-kinase-like protein 1 n=1 Tax=Sceloporus undulatus TaxID=8520 RepID=UPI001C4D8823|nr:phosphatidylinositol 4-phosphate 5-kinase-like protein 1 [Sceloporus undulatus]
MEVKIQDARRKSQRSPPLIMYRILWRIHEQWKLLGFFEINEDHELYEFTCMLKQGLKASVQEAIDSPTAADVRKQSDFRAVLKQIHEGFEMRTYAGPVFAWFRQFLGMMDPDYQQSLSCESSYLQFISNSKSRADFFLTNDKHFFLKTQSRKEIRFLLTNLPKYLDHMERYPHSILVKFLGVHSIIIPPEKKKYFIIMQSVFYPHEKILERYDIKGCEVNRWTDAAPEGSEVIMVFKDLNFGDNTICLEEQRAWFVRQVELDTQFLKELHVIDYSLLVGLQPLHEDERFLNKALVDIIARTTMSVNDSFFRRQTLPSTLANDGRPSVSSYMGQVLSSADHFYKLSPESKGTLQTVLGLYLKHRPSTEIDINVSSRSEAFLRDVLAPYLLRGNSCEEIPTYFGQMDSIGSNHISQGSTLIEASSFLDQNLRLLPNCRNPFHVIDGPEYRYFVGIIDLFTVFSFRKKLESLWKSIRYRNQSFSTVHPACYAQRLCQWVESHTT